MDQCSQHRARRIRARRVITNTIEGYFSVFKRGMKGVYQHCSEKHLHRYLAEFDFRYSNRVALGVNDGERAMLPHEGYERASVSRTGRLTGKSQKQIKAAARRFLMWRIRQMGRLK